MADTTEKEAKISIKVIVDNVYNRVVYAEADYTFVDILFSFMTLPMGTIVRLLRKHDDKMFEALGSLNNVYQSLEDFPECCLSTKKMQRFASIDDTKPVPYFGCRCSNCNDSSSGKLGRRNSVLATDPYEYFFGFPTFSCDGVFVSDIANFIITHDLCVEPYSSASSIRLLAELGITDMNHLEERSLEMSSSQFYPYYKSIIVSSYVQMLSFLNLALTTNCPFTHLVLSKINSVCSFVGSAQDNTFDQSCNLMKKEVSSTSKMHLQVSLQKSTGKLLFAEAEEDFVEFLFCILSIPLGTVVGTLMNGASSISCLNNIFKSISNMSVGRYLESQDIKDMLVKPHFGQEYSSKHQMFPLNVVPTPYKHQHTDQRLDEGYLKQSGLFIVTDDLTIYRSSSFSTFDMLKISKVSPEDIERCEVSIGLKEGLSMLKTSLRSCSTLTNSLDFQL
ncbi:uncharacterized protein LOC143604547 [Bidens hawaiensis]|uniref:uncharacterized protein LOC143604547 n=1 Tax=Bidens hawaiensis TaxID=980011 RepID=UPI004049A9FE